MEEQTKKWVLIGVSIAGMCGFCYYAFYEPSEEKEELLNPSHLENNISKQTLNAEQRKKERRFAYDRKVSSLDNFFQNEIEEDPFDTLEQVSDEPEKTDTVKEAVNPYIQPLANPSPFPRTEETEKQEEVIIEERRTGFASGTGGSVQHMLSEEESEEASIPVVVHEEVMAVSGSVVRLRSLVTSEVEGVVIPENTFFFGDVKIARDRLYIDVEGVTINQKFIPLELEAYDLSGNRGLVISGGMDKEIAGQAMNNAVSEVQRNVDVPLLRDIPFTSARKKIREKAIPVNSGIKLHLRKR